MPEQKYKIVESETIDDKLDEFRKTGERLIKLKREIIEMQTNETEFSWTKSKAKSEDLE